MKNRFPLRLIVANAYFWAVLLLAFAVQSEAHFSKGEGTQENPWRISNASDLDNVRNYLSSEYSDKYFRQEADIDMKTFLSPDGRGWLPIGNDKTPFFGNYEGNGYLILNLTISRPDSSNVGLFGVIENAAVSKLGLRDVRIVGGSITGALIGTMRRMSKVEQCYVTGYVSGTDVVGGLVGFVDRSGLNRIHDCYTTATVRNRGANIRANHPFTNQYIPKNIHHQDIRPQSFPLNGTGGLIGYMKMCDLQRCFVTGPVLYDYENQKSSARPVAEGLWPSPVKIITELDLEEDGMGDSSPVPRRSVTSSGVETFKLYWNTDITDLTVSSRFADTILGRDSDRLVRAETYEGFDFNEVWSIDEAKSLPYLKWEGNSAKSHNLPPLIPPTRISSSVNGRDVNISWVIKNNTFGIPDGFNIYRNERLINKTPVTSYDYTDESLELWEIYTYYITALYEGKESAAAEIFSVVPVEFGGGSGTGQDPYLVKTREHLNGVRYSLRSNYLQTADISLKGSEWIPIGVFGMAFSGSYNGNNHYISDMTISNVSNAGLFGTAHRARFSNIRLKDIRLKDVGEKSGGLIGEYYSTSRSRPTSDHRDNLAIRNCSATGSISAVSSNVGGLAGVLRGVTIWGSRADVSIVTGGGNSGGLIGSAIYSTIDLCAALGKLTARGEVKEIGGLVGTLNLTFVSNSYSLVNVSVPREAESVGGFAGFITRFSTRNRIINCFAAGRIRGGSKDIGGFIGTNDSEEIVVNSYWNRQKSGISTSAGGEGRRTAEMTFPYSNDTYVEWDFDTVWRSAAENDLNRGYPYHNIRGPSVLLVTTAIYTENLKRYNELTWDTDRDAQAYRIYRDDRYLATITNFEGFWKDEDVELYDTYSYYVTAIYRINGKDVESDKSNTQTTKPIRQ